MNRKNLQIIGPIDEDFQKVVDQDGTDVNIHIKNDGSLQVDGDIDVKGSISSGSSISGAIASPVDISEINTAGEFKIVAGNDITKDTSESLKFDVGAYGPLVEIDATTGEFKMYPASDLDDYLRFYVGTNGYAKISTNDDAGTNFAYLNINPEGDLHLKPITGDTIIFATKKLHFDGSSKTTYITESADDILDIYVGGINMLKLDEANGNIDVKTDNIRVLSESGGTYAGTDDTSLQTKAQINSTIVQTAEVTISEAEMDALHTTEKVLIAAQGSGKVIIPLQITAFADRDGSTAQSTAGTMWFAYDGETTTNSGGYIKRFMRSEAGDRVLHWYKSFGQEIAQSLTEIDNVPLTAKMDFAITSGSIDSCKLVIQYYVYDNS